MGDNIAGALCKLLMAAGALLLRTEDFDEDKKFSEKVLTKRENSDIIQKLSDTEDKRL